MIVLGCLAILLAVAAGVRSTWSPCGQSVLSTMTPLSERARGHRFAVTAAWFVVGSTVGGVTLGGGAAGLALAARAWAPSSSWGLGVAGALAVVGAALDARVFGLRVPGHHRQVNEDWLVRYRGWIYGLGFGWQIGVGLATYTMTFAVYSVVVLAAWPGSPAFSITVCALFGLIRGLAILPAARLTEPGRLLAFHRRFEALEPASLIMIVGVQALVAAVALAVAGTPMAVVAVVALASVAVATRGALGARTSVARRPARSRALAEQSQLS